MKDSKKSKGSKVVWDNYSNWNSPWWEMSRGHLLSLQGVNYPRRKLFGCNYLGTIFLSGNCPGENCPGTIDQGGGNCLGGNCPSNNYPRWELSRGQLS